MFCAFEQGATSADAWTEESSEPAAAMSSSSVQPFFIKLDIDEGRPLARKPTLRGAAAKKKPTDGDTPVAVLKELAASPLLSFAATPAGSSSSLDLRVDNPSAEPLTVSVLHVGRIDGLSASAEQLHVAAASSALLTFVYAPSGPAAPATSYVELKWQGRRSLRVRVAYAATDSPAARQPLAALQPTAPLDNQVDLAPARKPAPDKLSTKCTSTTTKPSTIVKSVPSKLATSIKSVPGKLATSSRSVPSKPSTSSRSVPSKPSTSTKTVLATSNKPATTVPASSKTLTKKPASTASAGSARQAFHQCLADYVADCGDATSCTVEYGTLLPTVLHDGERAMLARLEDSVRHSSSSGLRLRDEVDVRELSVQRELVLFLFDAYGQEYLRAALALAFGQLPLGDDDDARSALSKFIRRRVLDSTSVQHSHAAAGGSPDSARLRDALRRYALYKLLLVVWLADAAKSLCLLPGDGPLFLPSSKLKSSADVVDALAQRWLVAEPRRVQRELAELGYRPAVVQRPFDELPLPAAIDGLDDGAAVCRWAAALYHRRCWSDAAGVDVQRVRAAVLQLREQLAHKLRCPAAQPLHRAANAKQLLDCLSERRNSGRTSIENRELSKRVAVRDRLAIVELLWRTLSDHCLPSLLDVFAPALAAELAFVSGRRHDGDGQALLQHWCRAVAARHGYDAGDAVTGPRAATLLCLLVHHYHRQLLPYADIILVAADDNDAQRHNAALFVGAAQQLGGMLSPAVLASATSVVPVDDRTAQLLVAELCLRLLRDAAAQRSATIIQRCWLRHRTRALCQRRSQAALLLQSRYRAVVARRRYLQLRAAAVALQARRRAVVARRHYLQLRTAAVALQARWRGAAARRRFTAAKQAATRIQSVWRMRQQRAAYLRLRAAAVALQAHRRGAVARRHYVQQQRAAVTLQAHVRGWLQRRHYRHRLRPAAVRIQAAYRGHAARKRLAQQRRAAVALQAHVRGWLQRRAYQRQRQLIVTTQACLRRFVQRRRYLRQRAAAVAIQTAFRGAQQRRQYVATRRHAVTVQTWWRAVSARRAYCRQRAAAVAIQAAVRMQQQRRRYVAMRAAAVTIQTALRRHQARAAYVQQRAAAVTIQTALRRHQARTAYVQQRAAAVTIQAALRRHQARAAYLRQRAAAVTIQAAVRMRQARTAYLQQRAAAVTIQAALRMHQARAAYLRQRAAAVTIQAAVRMHRARAAYLQQRAAAVTIQRCVRERQRRQRAATTLQAAWRGAVVRRQVARQRAAAVKIQAVFRGGQQRRQFVRHCAAIMIQRAYRRSRC